MSKKIKKNKKGTRVQNSPDLNRTVQQDKSLSPEQAFQLALQNFQAGNLLRVEELCQQILHVDPDNAEVNHFLGVITAEQGGKINSAIGYIEKAIHTDPTNAEFHKNLGLILKNCSKTDEAIASFKKALSLKPDYAEAYNELIHIYVNSGRPDDAIACIKEILSLKPDSSELHNNLGHIYKEAGKFEKAISSFQKALAIKPGSVEAHMNLGLLLKDVGRMEGAATCFKNALSLNPELEKAHNNLGLALQDLNRMDEAAVSFKNALKINPDYARAHYNLGILFAELGKLNDAIACYKNVLDINPMHAEAYKGLSVVVKYSERDDVVLSMESLYAKEGIADLHKIFLGFALGKVFSDLKDYSKSFEFIFEANRLKRKSFEYSFQDEHDNFERVKETFSPPFFSTRNGSGSKDKTPIFIVGMPRSGTSLIEQILASHPQVYGAGELRILEELLGSSCALFSTKQFPECMAALTVDEFERIGTRYIHKLRKYSKDAKHIVDKMPHHFMAVGLIKATLPNAKIIHCMRNPMDNCLSIYKNVFKKGAHYYAYDLSELGRYYNLYLSLMEHWEKVLPGFMYTLRYEDMVSDQENQTRKLLDFCSLSWDKSCLDFHRTERSVKTASNAQVRQPMYKSSVELWKRYERQLEPLHKAIYGE